MIMQLTPTTETTWVSVISTFVECLHKSTIKKWKYFLSIDASCLEIAHFHFSLVCRLYLDPATNEFRKVELIPVKIDFMQVNTVKDKDERKWLVDTMTRLCRVFGSKVQEKEDCLEISTSL